MQITTEAKVGLVILTAFLFLTYMTFTVGGTRWGAPKGYRLDAVFDSVAGLDMKSQVKLAGVEVGEVESIRLEDNRARVTMRIRPDVKIRRGSRAAVRSTGLLGEKYLEIIPGEGPEFMKEEETIELTEKAADLENLLTRLSSIADDIKAVSTSLRNAIGTKEGERSLKEILANFESFTADLRDETPVIMDQINQLTAKLDSIATQLEQGQGTLGKLLQDEEVYDKLNSALGALEKLGEKLEKGEGTIGKLLTDDKAYNQLTGALEGLSNTIQRVERLKLYLGYRNEYQTKEGDNKSYFSLQIQPREDKYYLVELVDDPRGEAKETITQVTPPGDTTTTLKIRRRLEFSVLFAKRFGDLTLRAGLMENSGGIGAEYAFFDDRLVFGFDAWDFNSDDPEMERAHLKATGRLMPLKYIFIQGGYDNFLNRDIDTYFIGGGLRFEDEDLKYLLGSVPVGLR